MAQVVRPRVRLIGWTHFEPPDDVDWSTDAEGGQALAEFAGRACYQSWSKPNPATATNATFLAHILAVGHLAVLEHATATFYITGVSRSLTHELVRHRHLSFSQLSQRYVPEHDAQMVEPALIAADPKLHRIFTDAVAAAVRAYDELCEGLTEHLARTAAPGEPDGAPGVPSPQQRKQARQAARAVLPNATESRIVVTGNYRAWRHFIAIRASEHADVEIRALAVECLRQLQGIAGNAFGDFIITALPDGSEVAASPYALQS